MKSGEALREEVREAMWRNPATLTSDAMVSIIGISGRKKADYLPVQKLTSRLRGVTNNIYSGLLQNKLYGDVRDTCGLKKAFESCWSKGQFLNERSSDKIERLDELASETSFVIYGLENVKSLPKEKVEFLTDFLIHLSEYYMSLYPAQPQF